MASTRNRRPVLAGWFEHLIDVIRSTSHHPVVRMCATLTVGAGNSDINAQ
jgi:hypothetical protein